MRRITPPPTAVRPRIWTWLVAAVAIAVVLLVDRRPVLDRGALASEFAAQRVDIALTRLTVAPPQALPEALRGVNWWPAPRRTAGLTRLLSLAPDELLEAATLPTLVAPLGAYRAGPTEVRLREPAEIELALELRNVDLDLVVAELQVPAGTGVVPLEVDWIPGSRYGMVLTDGRDGAMLALAGFRVLDTAASQAAARAMADAHALGAPDHEGSSLLAALVALDAGLTLDAIERLTPLQSSPGYEAVARELHFLALESLGLDWSARRLMASGDGDGAEERR